MADRDFLTAVRERVVVFDGGMGATLEQFDLSSADYGGLEGKCHEALVLNRPDVIEGVHASMIEAGAEVVETDTFQGSRLKLDEWGLGEHTLEINRSAAEIARRAVGEARFVAGSIGPTGFLPASDDPTLGEISFRRLVEVFAEQAQGLVEGGADLIIIETAQDILEVKAAIFGAREAFATTGRTRPAPGLGLAASAGRKDASGHGHRGGADDADRARRRRDRAQLLDRARGHARRDPLPRRAQPAAGPLHPQRGPAAAGARRRDHLPRDARADLGGARRVRRAPRRRHRRRLLRDDPGPHPGDRRAGGRLRAGRASRARAGARLLDDDRDRPRAGAGADPGRRAGQLAGFAQGEGAAARRRLRRPRPDRLRSGRRRRPRARRMRSADRAPGRGRADGGGGRAHLADPARADPDRLDRARGDRGGAGADSRAGRSSTRSTSRPAATRPTG